MTLPRVVWLLMDGLPHELVRAYVGLRPRSALAELWHAGCARPLRPLAPNCQTPPSLFTLWSGYRPDEHGVLGYNIPAPCRDGRAPFVDAFEHWPRSPPLVWDLYAAGRQHLRTCAAPFMEPARLAPWLLSATHVFGSPLVPMAALGDGDALLLASGQTLKAHASRGEWVLRLDSGRLWSAPMAEEAGAASCTDIVLGLAGDTHEAVRFRAVQVNHEHRLVCLGQQGIRVSGSDAEARCAMGRRIPYVTGNPGKLYQSGQLGRHLDEGGGGEAESLLFLLMRDVHESFSADALWAIQKNDADLVVAYYPVMDLLGHQVLRLALNGLDLAHDGLVGSLLVGALDQLDAFVRSVRRHMPPGAHLLLNSDHGMVPIAWDVYPNTYFAQQGWLSLDAVGHIDVDASLVFFHPAENGLLALHPQRLAQRGLSPDRVLRDLHLALAAQGLAGLCASTGRPAPLGQGWSADQYLHAPAGARLCAATSGRLVQRSRKGGDHTTHCAHPWLQGVVMWSGTDPHERLSGGALELDAVLRLVLDNATAPA